MRFVNRAMPVKTGRTKIIVRPCSFCGAVSYEQCRKWVSEKTTTHSAGDDGEGRWEYRKTFHPER